MKKLLITIPLILSIAFTGVIALAVSEPAMAYPVKVCKQKCGFYHGKYFCVKKCKVVNVYPHGRGYHQHHHGPYINVYP